MEKPAPDNDFNFLSITTSSLPIQSPVEDFDMQYLRETVFLFITCILASVTHGQTVPPDSASSRLPDFAVISIKPNKLNHGWRMTFTPNGFSAMGMSLKMLVQECYLAYGPEQLPQVPEWADKLHYDIEAKVDEKDEAIFSSLSYQQRIQMVRALLSDQFKLAVHYETKQLPVYSMVVDQGGIRFSETPSERVPNNHNAMPTIYGRPGKLKFEWMTMDGFTRILKFYLDRPVIDNSNLKGHYEFSLEWAPDNGSSPQDTVGPSIFTALKEQLGLRLVALKGPVPILTIDHAEPPPEN